MTTFTDIEVLWRRDAAADWTSNNPTLSAGQVGYETDTGRFKVGDGSTAWTSLAYQDVSIAEVSVTQHEAALTITESQISDLGTYQVELSEGAFANGDKTKLDGIEASADVTDTANVTAAGAVMDSEVTNLAAVKAFDPADYATAAQGSTADSALQDVADDTTPQLGGQLDVNGNDIVSTSNGDITIAPNGTGNIVLGNYTLNADATVGAGQDNYVLKYDHSSGLWGPEEDSGAAGGDAWSDAVDADIVPDGDGTRDLGSSANRFAELHVDQIDLNGTTLDGTALADPGADAILAWDDGDTAGTEAQWWTLGAGLATDGSSLGVDGVLEDLDTLGAPASDGQIIVATGAGAFAYESGSTARTSLGAAALGANEFTGTQDFNGQQVEAFVNNVVSSVTGTLTTTAHSGNVLITSGNVTVPTTAGFNCVLIAGGAHTVTFNSTTSAAMSAGDIMTIVVQSSTVIKAVLTASADLVSFS